MKNGQMSIMEKSAPVGLQSFNHFSMTKTAPLYIRCHIGWLVGRSVHLTSFPNLATTSPRTIRVALYAAWFMSVKRRFYEMNFRFDVSR